MPRKKKKKLSPPKFSQGDVVRVKPGVTDPDFPDMPLGGWEGTIVEIHALSPPLYLIRWSKETLAATHPVYRKRCARDGLDFEEMWLAENELEPAVGSPPKIAQPTSLQTRPLSMDDQDDRVRAALDLTSDDPLPEVDEYSLVRYYHYLWAALAFPFEAAWTQEGESLIDGTPKVTVLGLGNPGDPMIDKLHGILCEARQGGAIVHLPVAELEVVGKGNNRRLVDDYTYWFWNWR